MSERKIIAVVGATGAQGGGLIRAMLADANGQFIPRAITRNTESDKAKALVAQGIEVVKADLDDVESLVAAFDGCYGAFCVTNFWDHFSAEKEKQQAKNLAVAAKRAGVEHTIWSTLEDTRQYLSITDDRMPVLQGDYNVPHFDAKGEADEYFREQGVPTTFLATSFYWENLIYFGQGPQPTPDGGLAITMNMGTARLPGIAAADIGKTALAIFKRGKDLIGETIGIAGEHLTGEEMASKVSSAIGREVRYVDVPSDAYRGFGFPGANEMGNMYQFKSDFNEQFVSSRNLDVVRDLHPDLQTFEQWLEQNAKLIPLPAEA
jgi:uncharacterized protein YbjT (DUF2867 family)